MKLFASTKNLIDKTKIGENVPSFKILEIVLVHCNLEDNHHLQNSEVLHTFTPNKCYAYLLNVEPNTSVFFKTYKTNFHEIIITFADQNG